MARLEATLEATLAYCSRPMHQGGGGTVTSHHSWVNGFATYLGVHTNPRVCLAVEAADREALITGMNLH